MPGDRVAMSTTLAGRDEGKYDKPNEVRLDRGPSHESFAHGPHRCVGMHLARRELHAAIEEFLKAVPTFHIAPGAEIVSTLGPIIQRSEERRVGQEWVSTCSTQWWPYDE